MIKAKDLVGRVYEGRNCVGFELWLRDEDGDVAQMVKFFKDGDRWIATAVLEDLSLWRVTVDAVTYGSLVNLAANGLLQFQSYLERRVQQSQKLCYIVSNAAKGM